jgi:hypothetical protein
LISSAFDELIETPEKFEENAEEPTETWEEDDDGFDDFVEPSVIEPVLNQST